MKDGCGEFQGLGQNSFLLGLTGISIETENQIHLIPRTFSELTKSRTWHSSVVTITDEELTISAKNFAYFIGNGISENKQKLEFPKLKKLNLENISLEQLSDEICKMMNLEELHLDFNKLETLPKEIGNLKNLTRLHLHHNELTTIPKESENLKKLPIDDSLKNPSQIA